MATFAEKKKLIDRAYQIAVGDLRSNYGDLGIYAGPKNHHEYWARDSFFASFGACSLGDFEMVRKNLDLFIKYQKENGQIALRIEERNHALHFLGIKKTYDAPVARFKCSQPWATDVVDTSALFIISALNYSKLSGNKKWLIRNTPNIIRAAKWLLSRKNEVGLINEDFSGSWADMTLKRGNVTYTNICVWKAFGELLKIDVGWKIEQKELGKKINKYLWSESKGYYVDWMDKKDKLFDHFFVDGNVLAIAWGLVNKSKARSIYGFIDKHHLSKVPTVTCYPRLPLYMDLFCRVIFPMYHPSNIFTWWAPWEILGRIKVGDRDNALRNINSFSEMILKNKAVYEVIDECGNPIRLPVYKSERQIAWSSGLFVYLIEEIRKNWVLSSV